jgi:nicotinamidase-related amidase
MQKKPDWRKDLDKYPRVAPDFDLEPKRTALMIIDMQYSDAHPNYGLGLMLRGKYPEAASYYFKRLAEVVVPNQIKLVKFFRQNGLRIIYITVGPMLADASDFPSLRRESWIGQGLVRYHYGTFEHGILDEIKPQDGELVINKVSASAFNSSAINQILRNMGIDGLVITGVGTNHCVETTARDAADRDYKCILLEDACATFIQEFHDATLRVFAQGFGQVQTTEEVISYLRKQMGISKPSQYTDNP